MMPLNKSRKPPVLRVASPFKKTAGNNRPTTATRDLLSDTVVGSAQPTAKTSKSRLAKLPKTSIFPTLQQIQSAQKAASTSHITILGGGKDAENNEFVRLLIKRGKEHYDCVIPFDGLSEKSKRWVSFLNRRGARLVPKAQSELESRLIHETPDTPTFFVASQAGWFEKRHFVLPDGVISPYFDSGSAPVAMLVRMDLHRQGKFRRTGTLAGAKELCALAANNSRLMLALCTSLHAPVASLLGQPRVAIQLYGQGDTAKTTALMVAGSLWGATADPNSGSTKAFGETWNATKAHKETHLLDDYNHTFLPIDETRAGDLSTSKEIRDFLQFIMVLEGGRSKGKADGSPLRTSFVTLLSSSNETLAQIARRANITVDAAYCDRLIDVPNPDGAHGIFEELHGSRDLPDFCERLWEQAGKNHGVIARNFLKKLVNENALEPEFLRATFARKQKAYLEKTKNLSLLGRNIGRLNHKFASLYAVGALAIEWGFFPWSKADLKIAILLCQEAHMNLVEQRGPSTQPSREKLINFLKRKSARFVPLAEYWSDPDAPGYVKKDDEGNSIYLLDSKIFHGIVGPDKARELLKELAFQGMVAKEEGKKPRYAIAEQMTTPEKKRKKRYFININELILQ